MWFNYYHKELTLSTVRLIAGWRGKVHNGVKISAYAQRAFHLLAIPYRIDIFIVIISILLTYQYSMNHIPDIPDTSSPYYKQA